MVIFSVVVPSFLTRRTDKQIRKIEERKRRKKEEEEEDEGPFSMIFYENKYRTRNAH